MAYTRSVEGQTLLAAANFQKEPQTIRLDAPYKKAVLNNLTAIEGTEKEITLGGYQAVVLEL